MSQRYLARPPLSTKMPPGVPYIVGNEAAERFSFYGMRAILVVVMTQHLWDASGQPLGMSEDEAKQNFHLFVSSAYLFPVFGAILSDAFLGKYRTIIFLSLIYCVGHLVLSLNDVIYWFKPLAEGTILADVLATYETRIGLAGGLILIAIGSGGIKPCVSAHVGDQFGTANRHLLGKVYGGFYFAINIGAFLSTLLTPLLLKAYGPGVAFGVPGVLMLLATWIFWLGRVKFVHVPPGGLTYLRELLSRDGLQAMGNLLLIYLFVSMFWALFDQTGSAWVLQSQKMDRHFLGYEWMPSQIQAVNPILILLFIPLFTYVFYPAIGHVFLLTPLRKISIGFFVASLSFAICALVEARIVAGEKPSILWQILAYAVITAAEIMISITCLEFSYTQAPKTMKSFVMAFYLLSVSLGNIFASVVNGYIKNVDGSSKLPGASYYWFFTGAMLTFAVVFIVVACTYRGRNYLQGEV